MAIDQGVPPLAETNHARVVERLKEVRSASGTPETLTIEWRGQPLNVDVIDMPVKDLFYNPSTHRIRAQRSHDPIRDQALDDDPWNAESQDYLHDLLRALPRNPSLRDPDFETLKKSLHDFKQSDPGLITRTGILVNGNTRRAALKDLGIPEMRVGVLPETTTWDDISAVELSLQLRKDHRRDYSYINRLLAINEQSLAGRPYADIAREFHIQVRTVEQDMWILGCLNELIDRSKVGSEQLQLMHFEDAQEKLRELHRRYVRESGGNKANSDLLKETRLAAIALDFSKTDIRLIEPDFQDRYLEKRLPTDLKIATEVPPVRVGIPGLDGKTVPKSNARLSAAEELTNAILRARAMTMAGSRATATQSTASARTYREIRQAFEDAIGFAETDAKVSKRSQAAPARIGNANAELMQCITDLALARGSRSLDEEAYDDAVQSLRSTLRKLAEASARSIKAPGDGVSWLLEIAKDES